MENNSDTLSHPHPLSLTFLTRCQCDLIKGHLVNMDNWFNEVFSFFNLLNLEFNPGNRIIDSFSDRFSFHLFSKCHDHLFKDCIQKLDNLAIESSNSPSTVLIITDVSIRNNVATSIVYIHVHNRLLVKTLHHTVNITSTKAEFFAIRCDIIQATYLQEISKIIVVTNSIYTAKKIFNPSIHTL